MRKILWLDDQFGIDPELDNEVNELYEELALATNLTDEEVVKEYNIVTVSNYPEFKQMMKESIFDAVILDIDGMGEADREERSLDGFYNSREDAITKKTSIVIYSGQVEESEREIKGFLSSIKNKNIECKVVRKIEGVEKLCEALMDIFDNDIWTKFPHIRELLEREELSQDGEWLKHILQSYIKQNFSSKIAYEFRGILEKIIKLLRADFEESLKKYYIRNLNRENGRKKDDKIEAINKVGLSDNIFIEQILKCSHCKPLKDNLFHDNHLVIPSKVMPREVKFALNYIWELSNIYHHCNEMTPDFNEIMANNNEKVYRMTYDAFLLVLEWYYQYEKKKLCKYIKI